MKSSRSITRISFSLILTFLLVLAVIPFSILVVTTRKSLDTRSRASSGVATLTFPLLSENDDAFEYGDVNGQVITNNTDGRIHFGWYQQAVGLRFNSLAMRNLKGKTIEEAYLTLTAASDSETNIKYKIFLENSDDCPKFVESRNNISSRPRTTNNKTWSLTNSPWKKDQSYQTPDIRSLVSEVTSRDAWQGKNLCVLLVKSRTDDYAERTFFSFANSRQAPKLIIRYQTGLSTITPTPATPPNTTLTPTPPASPSIFPSPTPSQAISPTPRGGPRTSRKKGVGLGMLPNDCQNFPRSTCSADCGNTPIATCRSTFSSLVQSLGVSWVYNWGTPQADYTWLDSSIEYVPMVWGAGTARGGNYSQAELRKYTNYAERHPGSYWLIWNEPNYSRQSNIHPDEAANIYKPLRDIILSADPIAKFIVGGVAWADVSWIENFRNEYKNLHGVFPPVDGWAFHHYAEADYSLENWRYTVNSVRTWLVNNGQGQKEIWLTEFGSLNSNGIGQQVMRQQLEWLEAPQQSWLTRYAWFAASTQDMIYGMKGDLFEGKLKDGSLRLNFLGEEYTKHPIKGR